MKAFPRDVNVQTMLVRHIGVENELGVNNEFGVDDEGSCGCCCDVCCDCDGETDDISSLEKKISKRGLLQSIGYDGGGREFRTNPISIRSLKQVRGFRYVTEYYGLLKDNTTVLTSGGTHIHISILNNDHENMEANATAMAIAFYKQFQKICGRKSNWARKGDQKTLKAVKDNLASRRDRYGEGKRVYNMKGSMLGPTRHQTLEFRGGRGSNDRDEILAWVEFLDNIVKVCNRKSIEGVQFKQLLKGERISAYLDTLTGWRKLGKRELEQKFNGSSL